MVTRNPATHHPAEPRKRAPRGRYAKTDETRETILHEALRVFASSGYRAGSVATIASNIGMTEAGIAYHFPNKAALLLAVLERRNDESRAMVNPSDDGMRTLNGIIRFVRSLPGSRGLIELYCVVSAEAVNPEHPAHEHFIAQRRESRDIFRCAFNDLASRNLLAPGVSADLAAAICSAHFDGAQIQWLLEPGEIDLVAQLTQLFRQFVPGFEPEEEPVPAGTDDQDPLSPAPSARTD